MSEQTRQDDLDVMILSEVQLLLAEKRTAMSTMRTGIAIFALPLSVLSVLVVTSKLYDWFQVLYLLVPLVVLTFALTVLAIYLIVYAMRRSQHYDHLIIEFKRKHSKLAELID